MLEKSSNSLSPLRGCGEEGSCAVRNRINYKVNASITLGASALTGRKKTRVTQAPLSIWENLINQNDYWNFDSMKWNYFPRGWRTTFSLKKSGTTQSEWGCNLHKIAFLTNCTGSCWLLVGLWVAGSSVGVVGNWKLSFQDIFVVVVVSLGELLRRTASCSATELYFYLCPLHLAARNWLMLSTQRNWRCNFEVIDKLYCNLGCVVALPFHGGSWSGEKFLGSGDFGIKLM